MRQFRRQCVTGRTCAHLGGMGYRPVEHVTGQNNARLNQAQEEVMRLGDAVNEMHEAAGSVKRRRVSQQFL